MGNTLKYTSAFYGAAVCGYGAYQLTFPENREIAAGYVKPAWHRVRLRYLRNQKKDDEKRADLKALDMLQVLDLFAGCGENFHLYPQNIDLWHGVEPNQHLHDSIKSTAEENGYPTPILELTAAEPIEYLTKQEDTSQDSIVVSKRINEIEDCDKLFREAFRVLKPGGIFVCWEAPGSSKCPIPDRAKFFKEELEYFIVEKREHERSSLVCFRTTKARQLSAMNRNLFIPGFRNMGRGY
eukprot:CAMPEP_0114499924 /NCGR_PEP_ID=MMETSP0109-20121206/7680_1 /TAXON_ID=29199 /ORGANISM="Chlorarachnion reptans, Strain CCCM449" /LENGTH=238 /DNA_ID=CAMNT_0001677531 /DNA_START=80 /DNA_END=796 /DNA_ORIENTATION=+